MNKMKTVFVGGINRSGASLLARLFDSHPDVASYPPAFNFPINRALYPIFESYAGVPMIIPDDEMVKKSDIYTLLDIPKEKPEVTLKWGKE